jgi:phage-related protein
MTEEPPLKPVVWVGSSRNDLRAFPDPVQDHMGYAIYVAQRGGKHRDAKVLSGFGGAGVLEVVKEFRGDTFRAVYTLRYAGARLCGPCVSEEIEDGARDTAARYRANRTTFARGREK